jgi:arylsulfatase A-like enzyme
MLFLISDDHSWTDLHCFGNTAVTSPNLDRLEARGARFDNCYVTSPQCSPNRSAILTGQTPHATRTLRLQAPMLALGMCPEAVGDTISLQHPEREVYR